MVINNYLKNHRITKLLSVLLLAFLFLAATNVPTSTVAAAAENTNSVSVQSGYPNSVYITQTYYLSKKYAVPPATQYIQHMNIDGFLYSGTLKLFSYQDAADTWIAIYKGYVYAD